MSLLTWSVAQLGLRPPYPFCDMIMMETCERLAGAWVRGGGVRLADAWVEEGG